MKIDLEFKETSQMLNVSFGEVQVIKDTSGDNPSPEGGGSEFIPVHSVVVIQGENITPLSEILDAHVLSIDYDNYLAFDTTELILDTSVIGG